MENKIYKFREGFNWKIKPEVAGKIIEKIAAKNNKEVTPQLLVKEAEKPQSPIHDLFDWDDKTAGYKWRLQQARSLIGSLVVDIVITAPEEVRAYVSISKTQSLGNAYCSISDVMDDEEKLQLIINEAKRKLTMLSKQLMVYEKMRDIASEIYSISRKLAS